VANPFAWAYDQWNGIPAPIREPIRSAAVSAAFGLSTAIATLWGAYFADHSDWAGFFRYLASPHSVGAIAVCIAAAYRARQGFRAATQTVSTSAAVSVPQPAPPAKIVAIDTVVAATPKEP
jgi:hypothetical protein